MKKLTDLLAERVLEELMNNGDIDSCSEYGEPGYSLEEGKKGILFGNWNDLDKHPNFMEWVEENYAIEWNDEWVISYEHGKAYRCSPDSYSWQQAFKYTDDGEMITMDDEPSEWIESCKVDDRTMVHTPSALPWFITEDDLIAEGFELIDDDLESGWYGRADSPQEILEKYLGEYREIVFSLNGVGQFSVGFAVYGRK